MWDGDKHSIIPDVTRCISFSLLITWPKKIAWHLCILFMNDLVVSASRNTISFDFFAVNEIRNILQRNQFFFYLKFRLLLFKNSPGLAFIHQNGFNIALQGSSSFLNGDVIICLYIHLLALF